MNQGITMFTVAIISFNVKEKLRIAIESIRRFLPGIPLRIWDNGSTDGTRGMMASDYPEIDYYYSPENLFFARGCNELVAQCATKYVLLMNADIALVDASVADIAAFMETRDEVIAVSPSVRDQGRVRHMASGIITPGLCIARDSFWGAAMRQSTWYRRAMGDAIDPHTVFDAEKITNCCCMLRRESFCALGGFSVRQILYWTEEEFAVRVKRRQMRQCVFGKSIVEHEHGSSAKKLPGALVRAICVHDRLAYMRFLFGPIVAVFVEAALLRPRFWKSIVEYSHYLSKKNEINRIKKTITDYRVRER
jgi:GT2 family glycosyltransferase